MSKIAIHVDPDTKKILGLWANSAEGLQSYYPEPWGRQLGADKMLDYVDHLRNDPPENRVSWDMWCEQLSGRTPVSIWWEQTDPLEGESLADSYQRLVSS